MNKERWFLKVFSLKSGRTIVGLCETLILWAPLSQNGQAHSFDHFVGLALKGLSMRFCDEGQGVCDWFFVIF